MVSSAEPPETPRDRLPRGTGAEQIRTAAIELFGRQGFRNTSLKAVAERAGVSAPLVIHHFGSKVKLRRACDKWVAEQIRELKSENSRRPGPLSSSFITGEVRGSQPLIRYLLRALLDGGEEMNELFDRLTEEYASYLVEAEQLGLVHPTGRPRDRAVLLLLQVFGSMLLGHQMKRQFGFDPLADDTGDPGAYLSAVLDLYSAPLITPAATEKLQRLRDQEQDVRDPGPDKEETDE